MLPKGKAKGGARRTVSDVVDFFWPKTETENIINIPKVTKKRRSLALEDYFAFQIYKNQDLEASSLLMDHKQNTSKKKWN